MNDVALVVFYFATTCDVRDKPVSAVLLNNEATKRTTGRS